jgi:hypothetical protein
MWRSLGSVGKKRTGATVFTMTTSATTWLERFSAELGVAAPSPAEVESLLGLAGVAAHASERVAAPISCWLVARSGRPVEEAVRIAESLATEFGTEQ